MIHIVNKQLTLSIIIPVYNEEHYIRSCLDSIVRQTHAPDEVIVVDNNCTDKTIAIAQSYGFVRVVREKQQGRGHARTAGFNAAKSDIIGRIDADSVLTPDWCERVLTAFSSADAPGGVTGLARVALLPRLQKPASVLWVWLYNQWSLAENGFELMWGANMAIRRDVWRAVSRKVCDDDNLVHEDQDVSFLVLAAGEKIVRDNKLLMNTDGQTFHYFPKLVYYSWLRHTTRRRHKLSGDYDKIEKTFGWPQRIVMWLVSPFIFVPFFVVSLALWPLDVIIHRISRTTFRHTS